MHELEHYIFSDSGLCCSLQVIVRGKLAFIAKGLMDFHETRVELALDGAFIHCSNAAREIDVSP
jgi:hypothetical protein